MKFLHRLFAEKNPFCALSSYGCLDYTSPACESVRCIVFVYSFSGPEIALFWHTIQMTTCHIHVCIPPPPHTHTHDQPQCVSCIECEASHT